MHEWNNDGDYAWNSWSHKEWKKKHSTLRIVIISILSIFVTCFFLFCLDLFLFYKSNIVYFKNQKASFEILSLKVSKHLNDKNISWLKKDLSDLKSKRLDISQKLFEYKQKPLFKIFGISNIFSKIERAFDIFIPLSEEIINFQKSYKDIFNKKVWSNNPVKDMNHSIDKLILLIDKLKNEIDSINYIFLSDKIKNDIWIINNNIKLLENLLVDISNYSDLILQFTWESWLSTVAILFQNSNEIRPTWWFIWSFMIVKFNNWNLLKYNLHDIYEFDWQLYEKIRPPYEWQVLVWNKSWSLRDSNINPDLNIAAKNFNNFFEKAWWETIDHFIFIDKTIVSDFLKILWPVRLDYYNIGVNSENFDFIMQYFIEGSSWTEFVPAKFVLLNDFHKAFTEKVVGCLKEDDLSCFVNFYKLKDKMFSGSSLQLVSLHDDVNGLIKKHWFKSGLPKENFIAPIFTSISWNKSDKFIETYYEINKKSDFEFSLDIMRSHDWTSQWEDRWQYLTNNFEVAKNKKILKDIMWYWWNRTVLQLYMPIEYSLLMQSWELISKSEWKKSINISSRNWQQWALNVYEIELPIIYPSDSIIIKLDFKSENTISKSDIMIWKQPWLILWSY